MRSAHQLEGLRKTFPEQYYLLHDGLGKLRS
jgi:hypothetical protein